MLPATVDTLIHESIDVYLKAKGFRPPTSVNAYWHDLSVERLFSQPRLQR